MIDEILSDPDLHGIAGRSCEENDVAVEICADLLKDGDLDDEKIVILKVDQYYSSSRMHNPPKSVDCLIVVKCDSGCYDITVAELRDTSSLRNQRMTEFLEKFRTTFLDFMGNRFACYFDGSDFPIEGISACLVIDPFNARELTDEQYRRKFTGTMLELFQLQRPFRIGDKEVWIEPKRPNPTVCECG